MTPQFPRLLTASLLKSVCLFHLFLTFLHSTVFFPFWPFSGSFPHPCPHSILSIIINFHLECYFGPFLSFQLLTGTLKVSLVYPTFWLPSLLSSIAHSPFHPPTLKFQVHRNPCIILYFRYSLHNFLPLTSLPVSVSYSFLFRVPKSLTNNPSSNLLPPSLHPFLQVVLNATLSICLEEPCFWCFLSQGFFLGDWINISFSPILDFLLLPLLFLVKTWWGWVSEH